MTKRTPWWFVVLLVLPLAAGTVGCEKDESNQAEYCDAPCHCPDARLHVDCD